MSLRTTSGCKAIAVPGNRANLQGKLLVAACRWPKFGRIQIAKGKRKMEDGCNRRCPALCIYDVSKKCWQVKKAAKLPANNRMTTALAEHIALALRIKPYWAMYKTIENAVKTCLNDLQK